MITIAATPQGELLVSYSIGAAVDSEIELDDETFEELGDQTVMAVTIRKGKFNGRISRTARDPRDSS